MNSTPGFEGCNGKAVDAVSDLGVRIGELEVGLQAAVDRLPRLAAIFRAECTCSRDGDEKPFGVARVLQDGVQAHPTRARRPEVAFDAAQLRQLLPGRSAVARAEQGRVFHTGVDDIRIGQGGFQIPHPLELPGVMRSIVPLVGAGVAVVFKLVANRFPSLAAIIGTLHHLPEPAAGLRSVQPVGVGGGSLEMVNLPAGKMWAADIPFFAAAVRRQDKRTLACAYQYPYTAHEIAPF